MVYRKDLCTRAEYENMTIDDREKYLDKIYGGSSTHRVLAEIVYIFDNAIEVNHKYFIFEDDTLQEFCLFRDSPCNHFISRNDTLIKFCIQNKLSKGDNFINEIFPNYKKIGFAFRNLTLENVNKISEPSKSQKIINEKKFEIEQLEESISQLRDLKNLAQDDYDKEISFQKQRLREEYSKESEKLQNLIENKQKEISTLTQEKDLLEEKLKFLRAYGINFPDEDSDEEKKPDFDGILDFLFGNNPSEKNGVNLKTFDYFEEMSDYWQSHLNTAKYGFLKYDMRILESLYFGLQTDQLILLMGNPGTGKTSLVKALAKSFNFADAKIIPVQSNWTDKSDLLGYYNPIEKNYVSTPFLDALINFSRQAENNPEKLFIICLDEMNLSHIEYYFAEFLSILQDDNAEITLYSEQLQKDILYELQNSGFEIDGDKIVYEGTPLESLSLLERKYYFELRRLAQMLKNYPAKFKIPKNVKFFGTLNQDETTLDISPKVLDRSYVIRVEKFFEEEIPVGDETPLQYKPLENYGISEGVGVSSDFIGFLKNFKAVNISRRITDKILFNEKFVNWEGVIVSEIVYDYIIASCVLPKVRLDEENYEKYAAEIEKLITDGEFELSLEIWQRINSPEEKIADFWRR